MQYLIIARDGTDENALSRRMAARPSHLENIAKLQEKGCVLCAGGITNDEGRPVGSFLAMDFASKEQLDAYLESEPYIAAGVWQDVKVETCNVVVLNNEKVGK